MASKKEHGKSPYPAGSAGKKGEGVTSLAMKQHGRNLARAMNQRSHGGGRGK